MKNKEYNPLIIHFIELGTLCRNYSSSFYKNKELYSSLFETITPTILKKYFSDKTFDMSGLWRSLGEALIKGIENMDIPIISQLIKCIQLSISITCDKLVNSIDSENQKRVNELNYLFRLLKSVLLEANYSDFQFIDYLTLKDDVFHCISTVDQSDINVLKPLSIQESIILIIQLTIEKSYDSFLRNWQFNLATDHYLKNQYIESIKNFFNNIQTNNFKSLFIDTLKTTRDRTNNELLKQDISSLLTQICV